MTHSTVAELSPGVISGTVIGVMLFLVMILILLCKCRPKGNKKSLPMKKVSRSSRDYRKRSLDKDPLRSQQQRLVGDSLTLGHDYRDQSMLPGIYLVIDDSDVKGSAPSGTEDAESMHIYATINKKRVKPANQQSVNDSLPTPTDTVDSYNDCALNASALADVSASDNVVGVPNQHIKCPHQHGDKDLCKGNRNDEYLRPISTLTRKDLLAEESGKNGCKDTIIKSSEYDYAYALHKKRTKISQQNHRPFTDKNVTLGSSTNKVGPVTPEDSYFVYDTGNIYDSIKSQTASTQSADHNR